MEKKSYVFNLYYLRLKRGCCLFVYIPLETLQKYCQIKLGTVFFNLKCNNVMHACADACFK